jgi:hypothetical protein
MRLFEVSFRTLCFGPQELRPGVRGIHHSEPCLNCGRGPNKRVRVILAHDVRVFQERTK